MNSTRFDEGAFAELSHSIGLAASGSVPWSHFIEQLGVVTGHGLGIFYHEYVGQRLTRLSDVVHGDEELTRRYREYYQHLNPYLRNPRVRVTAAGTFGPINAIEPRHSIERTEFYRDFVAPQKLSLDESLFLTTYNDGKLVSSIALCRRQGQRGLPLTDAARLIGALMPHLQTAFQLSRRVAELEVQWASLRDTLDRLPYGVILLDERGRPCNVNHAARQIAEQNDGLRITDDGLRGARSDETRSLTKLVLEAAQTATGVAPAHGGVLRLKRPSLRPPLELLVCPLPERDVPLAAARPSVAVFVSAPSEREQPVSDVFRTLYALSPAQARVATLLAAGYSLTAAADKLCIKRETARTHLKGIFLKTGTSRQAQLVRLALSGPATLRSPQV